MLVYPPAIHVLRLDLAFTSAYPYIMRDTSSIIVLSVVAIILVLGIGLFIAINPWVAVELAPILVAISVIIRAIGGSSGPSDNNPTR
jgi:hypothetical protein